MDTGVSLKWLLLLKFGTIRASKINASNELYNGEFKIIIYASMILKRERGRK